MRVVAVFIGAPRTVEAGGSRVWWTAQGTPLPLGAFSENLVIEQALEGEICIGDVFRIGKAVVQVSLPRDPCRTIDRLTGIPGLHARIRESGRCGFHMRTLQPGEVRDGDAVEVAQRAAHGITVSTVLNLYHGRSLDRELFRRLEALPEFAEQGKREIGRRLAPG